jgi:hypothetical protein
LKIHLEVVEDSLGARDGSGENTIYKSTSEVALTIHADLSYSYTILKIPDRDLMCSSSEDLFHHESMNLPLLTARSHVLAISVDDLHSLRAYG